MSTFVTVQNWYSRWDERRVRRARTRFPGWRDRKHRRPLVLAWAAALFALVALSLVDWYRSWWFVVLWAVGYVLWLGSWLLLRSLTGAISDAMADSLDERERAMRDRSAFIGFQAGFAGIVAIGIFLFANAHDPDIARKGALLLFTLALGMGALPTALVAWTASDDDPEDLGESIVDTHGAAESRP